MLFPICKILKREPRPWTGRTEISPRTTRSPPASSRPGNRQDPREHRPRQGRLRDRIQAVVLGHAVCLESAWDPRRFSPQIDAREPRRPESPTGRRAHTFCQRRRALARVSTEPHVPHDKIRPPERCATAIPAIANTANRTLHTLGASSASSSARAGRRPPPRKPRWRNDTLLARHSLADLRTRSDFWLGEAGRLTSPLIRRPGGTHYEPIGWSDAFEAIARQLRALDSPDRAIFCTSGRTGNEAALVYQLASGPFKTGDVFTPGARHSGRGFDFGSCEIEEAAGMGIRAIDDSTREVLRGERAVSDAVPAEAEREVTPRCVGMTADVCDPSGVSANVPDQLNATSTGPIVGRRFGTTDARARVLAGSARRRRSGSR